MLDNYSLLKRKKRGNDKQFVDFNKLDINTLKRYKRIYKLKLRHNSTKQELVNAITKHFQTIEINEDEVIELFLESISLQQDSS